MEFKNTNDKDIFNMLNSTGQAFTRPEIVKETRIARTTVYDALNRLILDGYVRKYSHQEGTIGRPKVFFEATDLTNN